jgi:hypothetical protein
MKTHTLDGNVKVRTFVPPPPDFDPLSANQSDLLKHGFPAVPESREQRELYKRLFQQMKGRFRYIEPTFGKPNKNRGGQYRFDKRRKKLSGVQAGNEYSNIWSGGVVYSPSGSGIRWVTGAWTIPNVSAPPEDGDYYASIWIGIDGDDISSDVIQAGVNCDVSRSHGAQSKPTFSLWWEWYQDEPNEDTGQVPITKIPPPSPGDLLAVTICTQGPGSTEALVFFANVTQAIGTSFLAPAQPGVALVGNCAEWIVERPRVNGSASTLADYGQVFFSSCAAAAYASDAAIEIVDSGSGNYINMVQYGDDALISQGILVAPTVVECVYVGGQ